MEIKEIEINEVTIWLVIEPIRMNTKNGLEIISNEFICYYNFNKPTDIIFGELIKDENNRPKIFESSNSAIDYTTDLLKEKI